MAQMTPTKHTLSEFNNGTGAEYGNQVFPASDLTKMAENSAYAIQVAETSISNTEYTTNKASSITNDNKASTTIYPSNKAIVDYVDAQISSSITTALGGNY